MANEQAQKFIDALHALEDNEDLDSMVELFTEEAELQNPTDHEPHRGRDGARQFWDAYRHTFEEIHSDFRNVAEADGVVTLEWTSHGRLSDGKEIDYDGVSIVEYQDGRVRRFRTYFDSHDLGAHMGGRAH